MSTRKNKRKENRIKNKKSELTLSLGEEKNPSIRELPEKAIVPIGGVVIASSSKERSQTSQSWVKEHEPEVKNSPESTGDNWEAESDNSPKVGQSSPYFENNTS